MEAGKIIFFYVESRLNVVICSLSNNMYTITLELTTVTTRVYE